MTTSTTPAVPSAIAVSDAERASAVVECVGSDGTTYLGTGFKVPGKLVVASHVYAGCDAAELELLEGSRVSLTAASAREDLSVGTCSDGCPQLATLVPAGHAPTVGDAVTLVGYPGGGQVFAAAGTIVAVDVPRRVGNATVSYTIPDSIVVAAQAFPGMSGGPAIDARGRVVGVIEAGDGSTAILTPIGDLPRAMAPRYFPAGSTVSIAGWYACKVTPGDACELIRVR